MYVAYKIQFLLRMWLSALHFLGVFFACVAVWTGEASKHTSGACFWAAAYHSQTAGRRGEQSDSAAPMQERTGDQRWTSEETLPRGIVGTSHINNLA